MEFIVDGVQSRQFGEGGSPSDLFSGVCTNNFFGSKVDRRGVVSFRRDFVGYVFCFSGQRAQSL